MKIQLLLADAATVHPDGTFSLLRGGVDRAGIPVGQPLAMQAALVVRLINDQAESGRHTFSIKLMSDKGVEVPPGIEGNFSFDKGIGGGNMVFNLRQRLPDYGRYVVVFECDGTRHETVSFEIVKAPPLQN